MDGVATRNRGGSASRELADMEAGGGPSRMGDNGPQPLASGPKQPKSFVERVYTYREYIVDWVVIACLIALLLGMQKASARQAFVLFSTLYKHSYPLKPNTFPTWSVGIIAWILPLTVFICYKLIYKRPTWHETYRVCVGNILAVLLVACFTDCLKVPVGRLRPNFIAGCWEGGPMVWHTEGRTEFGAYAQCVNDHEADEYRKSWPSGHSSWTAAGLGYLAWWLVGQTRALSGGTFMWRLVLSLTPIMFAVVVAVSRVTDQWHHPSDACSGFALGLGLSLIVYLQHYPWFFHEYSQTPVWELSKLGLLYSHINGCSTGPLAGTVRTGGDAI